MSYAKCILLVDDNSSDVELTLVALEKCRLAEDVVVTRDGAEALEYLYSRGQFADRPPGNPTVVFLDLKMPRIDGLTFLRQVKSDPLVMAIPVVVMTSSNQVSDIHEAYRLGANAYIVKPVNFDEFVDTIAKASMFWCSLNTPPEGCFEGPFRLRR